MWCAYLPNCAVIGAWILRLACLSWLQEVIIGSCSDYCSNGVDRFTVQHESQSSMTFWAQRATSQKPHPVRANPASGNWPRTARCRRNDSPYRNPYLEPPHHNDPPFFLRPFTANVSSPVPLTSSLPTARPLAYPAAHPAAHTLYTPLTPPKPATTTTQPCPPKPPARNPNPTAPPNNAHTTTAAQAAPSPSSKKPP